MNHEVRYTLSDNGETVITQFNRAKPFSSFFPGIAGIHGIPLWVFYVNRGQCIASFGIENKDASMLEFFPANRAYQLSSLLGFRTFFKVFTPAGPVFYEPFRSTPANREAGVRNEMAFAPTHLRLDEVHPGLKLRTTVTYMTIPGENFPGLIRKVEVRDLESGGERAVEIIDGLPWVNAYGLETWVQKNMSRTGEAWVEVSRINRQTPVFKVKTSLADRPEVDYFQCGHFSVYYDSRGLLPPIVDPQVVFGPLTDLNHPAAFLNRADFQVPEWQAFENFTPCSMTHKRFELSAENPSMTLIGVFGHAPDIQHMESIVTTILEPNWYEKKAAENGAHIDAIESYLQTFSAFPLYDRYSAQTFLDNVLRGGMPVTIAKSADREQVFHVYSRKHGDLERDYNYFSFQATQYSQGNGNFRDINQNRRNDVWFNPRVEDGNIKTFYNLIQLDGHNPLVLKGKKYFLKDKSAASELAASLTRDKTGAEKLKTFLEKPFTPGSLIFFLNHDASSLHLADPANICFEKILLESDSIEDTDFGEGYWSDHWTYNLDLVESFLSLFPDRAYRLFFEDRSFTYYRNHAWINPRRKRYILRYGKPFQTNNIEENTEHRAPGADFDTRVRTRHGKGEVYTSNLFAKFLCLLTNKIATLDPFGVGVELEGGKTNWNDSVNGLPGLFGSSTNETLELKRLVLYMLDLCRRHHFENVEIPRELYRFNRKIGSLLRENARDFSRNAFEYWDQSAEAKERYRESVKHGIHGELKSLSHNQVTRFLKRCLAKLNNGLERAADPETGVINSYFMHELVEYDTREDKNGTMLVPKRFTRQPTALFLESPVHFLKIADRRAAEEQYRAVRSSPLYDPKLKMYKVCASLEEMPKEMGRCTVFSPGWLENESVFLHMEYKFLFEVLRSGLHDAFFDDFMNALVPFQDPQVYGRSVIENCTFIVSSANANPRLHGAGFVARLSGSTAEFLSIWLYMNLGPNPFRVNARGELSLHVNPVLSCRMFNTSSRTVEWISGENRYTDTLPENHFAFVLFGKTLVVYRNPGLRDTFGKKRVKPVSFKLTGFDGAEISHHGAFLEDRTARAVRDGAFRRIDIDLG
jgi:hypothetical protein